MNKLPLTTKQLDVLEKRCRFPEDFKGLGFLPAHDVFSLIAQARAALEWEGAVERRNTKIDALVTHNTQLMAENQRLRKALAAIRALDTPTEDDWNQTNQDAWDLAGAALAGEKSDE